MYFFGKIYIPKHTPMSETGERTCVVIEVVNCWSIINSIFTPLKSKFMNSFEKIKELIAATEADAQAFYGKRRL